jgi:IPT/TIG domain
VPAIRRAKGKSFLLWILGSLTLLAGAAPSFAGGPRWVAGPSYFNASAKGQPVVWANGQINYYVDQGSLSATVNNAQANAMVASAVAVWNAVPTAAVKFTVIARLSEDVNGTNVMQGPNGLILPTDIQPTATNKPLAVIYDEDGSVINAFYGTGASSPASCQQDGVFTRVDNMAVSGNIAHSLMLINGLCATNATNLAILEYQMIRGFGRILGLDWSQTNEEMFTANDLTTEGLAGWPIMHPIERLCNATGVACMPNATTLRLDDIAALNRLYPVTAANLASFSGKKLTAPNTISIQGTIQFKQGQGMQGVNVVLRPMIPGTDLPDVRYTVTAVSGVFFQGNAGNPITGTTGSQSNPPNSFGSDDQTLEGFFDLSGVPLPSGETIADYQLTFEAVNPLYTSLVSVGPYTTSQVTPSGTMPAINLPQLSAGSTQIETVAVGNSADDSLSGNDGSEASPASIPLSGEWTARMAGYGHSSWFQWYPRANREFTVEAQALDENGEPTNNKANLLAGIWNGTDAVSSSPEMATPTALNGSVAGLTTLPVVTSAAGELRLGVADARGDGRPDYLYRGRVLYADSVLPARLPAPGGPIVIRGMGFRLNTTVTVNGVAAAVTSVSPNEITAIAPPSGGVTGNVPVQVQDPQTLGVAIIADGLSYSAQNGDSLTLLNAPNGTIPAGVPQPFTVQAMNWDDEWPAANIPVTYAVTSGTATLGCGQTTCTVTTSENGTAALMVSANSSSLAQITASLSNGASIQAEFSGIAPPAIGAVTPDLYLAIGAAIQWSPQALVLVNGSPAAGQSVTWSSSAPGLNVPATPSISGADGVATQPINAGPLNAEEVAPLSACLSSTSGCTTFTVFAVHTETAQLSAWSGVNQIVTAGQAFAPVTLEVTDAIGHPMAGASVTFYETLRAWTPDCPAQGSCPPAPLLAQAVVQTVSGADGLATLTPYPIGNQPGRLYVVADVGQSTSLDFELESLP